MSSGPPYAFLFPRRRSQPPQHAAPTVLKAADTANLIPATVFFRGQVASVQARNSGGVKLPDGMLVLCALVDTSCFWTAQKYQGYFITEVTLDINGQLLKPGAYGVGFVEGNKFLVRDSGAHDLFTVKGRSRYRIEAANPLAGSGRHRAQQVPALHQSELCCLFSRLGAMSLHKRLYIEDRSLSAQNEWIIS